jgi:secretion/DNA translocation related TadE-like protein
VTLWARSGTRSSAAGPTDAPRKERGAVSVLMVAGLALALVLMLAVARLGHAASDKARAETAADAAALAAAGAIARRGDDPSAAASSAAAENGGRLVRCDCGGRSPTVTVSLGTATVQARAEVRFECFADPDEC